MNELFDLAEKSAKTMFITAETIRESHPDECDKLRFTAAKLQDVLYRVISMKPPVVIALTRKSPASKTEKHATAD